MESSSRPGNLLTVDEGMRPRANSDPIVITGGLLLPEIKVEDCTDLDLPAFHELSTTLPFGSDDPPRRRSNTCPEDLFRKRNGRPPTPPPGTFRKGHRFRSGFTKPVLKESVSFTHHKLSKLTESEDAEDVHIPSGSKSRSAERLEGADTERLQCQLSHVSLEPKTGEKREPRCSATTTCGKSSPEESCSSQNCGVAAPRDAEASKSGGSVAEVAEDAFLSQSSVKCRCSQNSATALDSTRLQAC